MEKKIGSKYFYIEDPGVSKTETDRPYIELQSLKLYEGPFEDVSQEERNYVKTFNGEETRYIMQNWSWTIKVFKLIGNANSL